jgi:putative transcriptional regulator
MTGEELGAKLLQSVREMKAGKAARKTEVAVSPVVHARNLSGLSQAQFAALLGVSIRTLQDWEQGRREPTGAARTLIRLATLHPEALRDLQATSSSA